MPNPAKSGASETLSSQYSSEAYLLVFNKQCSLLIAAKLNGYERRKLKRELVFFVWKKNVINEKELRMLIMEFEITIQAKNKYYFQTKRTNFQPTDGSEMGCNLYNVNEQTNEIRGICQKQIQGYDVIIISSSLALINCTFPLIIMPKRLAIDRGKTHERVQVSPLFCYLPFSANCFRLKFGAYIAGASCYR